MYAISSSLKVFLRTCQPIFLSEKIFTYLLWVAQVQEETGFDVSKLLNKDEFIEKIFGQQRVRLYIIAGVRDDTAFAPQTKKEISVCYSFVNKFQFHFSLNYLSIWNLEQHFIGLIVILFFFFLFLSDLLKRVKKHNTRFIIYAKTDAVHVIK